MKENIQLKRLSNKKLSIEYKIYIKFEHNDEIIYLDPYIFKGIVELYNNDVMSKNETYRLTQKTNNKIKINISKKYNIRKIKIYTGLNEFNAKPIEEINIVFENKNIILLIPSIIIIKGDGILQKVRKIKIENIL